MTSLIQKEIDRIENEVGIQASLISQILTALTGMGSGGGIVSYKNLADASVQSTAPTSTADKNWWIGYRINSSKAPVTWDADGVVTNLIRIRDDNGNILVKNLMHIKGLDCKTDGNFHFYDKNGNYLSYSGGVSSNSAVSYADYDSDVITVTPAFLYPSSKEYFVRIQGHLTDGVGSSGSVVITADEEIS